MPKLSEMGFEITLALIRLICASCTFPPCAAIASSSSVALLVARAARGIAGCYATSMASG